MQQDELELIEKAKAGDSVATEILVNRYRGLIRKIVRKYFTNNGTSEDLMQDGLLGIFKAINDYDITKNDNFTAYAAMCIDSHVKDGLRAATREKHRPLNDAVSISSLDENGTELPSDLIYDPIHNYIDREGSETFYNKISTICTEQQVNVVRFFLEGYSYIEIASMMKLDTKKIDNILYTAKNRIKKNRKLFQ